MRPKCGMSPVTGTEKIMYSCIVLVAENIAHLTQLFLFQLKKRAKLLPELLQLIETY